MPTGLFSHLQSLLLVESSFKDFCLVDLNIRLQKNVQQISLSYMFVCLIIQNSAYDCRPELEVAADVFCISRRET